MNSGTDCDSVPAHILDMPALGVTYSPVGPALPHPTTELLKARNIGYVRVQWVDLTNIVRYRILPLSYFDKLLKSERPAIHLTKATLGLVFLSLADGFGATGELAYVCDLNSIKICTYAPGHASIMGWFQEKYPPPGPNPSYDINLCPRTLGQGELGYLSIYYQHASCYASSYVTPFLVYYM